LATVRDLIGRSALPEEVKAASLSVFERLARAEASVHGVDIEEVHFHEIGAVDSIVDIVGFCSAVHRLGLKGLFASPLPLGSGTITTEHGLLPVPAPATLALMAQAGAPTRPSPGPGELVTPTGAALLTTLATFVQPAMRVRAVGYGFGTKEFPWANALRVWMGDSDAPEERAHPARGRAHTHAHPHAHNHVHPHAENAPLHDVDGHDEREHHVGEHEHHCHDHEGGAQ
jgi:hypothetical protein